MENIVIAQINFAVGDIERNCEKIKSLISRYKNKILVFTELAICGYSPEDLFFHEDFVQETENAINKIKNEASKYNVALIIGSPIYEAGVLYNAILHIESQQVKIIHKKNFLPNYGMFDEKRYFTSESKSQIVNIRGKKILSLICEDLWQMNNLTQFEDIDLLISLNASPYEQNKIYKRLEIVRKASFMVKVPIIYLNLVGGQDSFVFDGSSFIYFPDNQVAMLNSFEEEVAVANEIDKCQISDIKKDSNSDNYNAICLGLKDYFQKNNISKAIIALSGGIDSALSTAITIDALGIENVKLVLLPSEYTSKTSFDDAYHIIETLKIQFFEISIEDIRNALANSLADIFKNFSQDKTEENMQSRIRGLIMMSLSNKLNAFVVTTGNKSEYACGYATIYGDMCGAFAPLKDLYKTQIYKLAQWRNNNIPQLSTNNKKNLFNNSILTKDPTAELKFDQKDSDNLPSYDRLDKFLEEFIDNKKTLSDINIKGIDAKEKKRIVSLIKMSEYKRRQSAIGVKISKCSFDRDWRYPICSNYDHD